MNTNGRKFIRKTDHLFQTDQTHCYDTQGEQIQCAGTGQDGDTRAGKPWPVPRFETDRDMVTDRTTGFVWPRDAGLCDFPLFWTDAYEWVDRMNRDRRYGIDTWRLPSRSELFTLVSHARITPAVTGRDQFTNVYNGYYWTGTPCARHTDQAWCVDLAGGRVLKGMTHRSYMVWPVSGHTSSDGSPHGRFDVDALETLDKDTGLSWLRTADAAGATVTWPDALAFVRQMNENGHLGHHDWRLPNIREIASLLDDTRHSPAVFQQAGFQPVRSFYWSATTSVYNPSYAWTLYARDGYIGVGYKPNPEFFIWPVRTAL